MFGVWPCLEEVYITQRSRMNLVRLSRSKYWGEILVDPGNLLVLTAVIVSLAGTWLTYRLTREIKIQSSQDLKIPEEFSDLEIPKEALGRGTATWIPWADRLLYSAGLLSLLFIALPLYFVGPEFPLVLVIANAMGAASIVLALFCPFALIYHYKIGEDKEPNHQRQIAEPKERSIVITGAVLAICVFFFLLFVHWPSSS